jgi:hypothetical protein
MALSTVQVGAEGKHAPGIGSGTVNIHELGNLIAINRHL